MFKRRRRRRKPRAAGPRMNPGDLRLTPEDRPAGGSPPRSRKPSRKGRGRGGSGRNRSRRSSPTRRRSRSGIFGRLVYWTFVLGVWVTIGGLGFVGWHAMHLPPQEELAVPERPANIMIVASDGTLIGNRGETGGEEVRLFELPAHLSKAVIAIEDRRFYSHFGVDPIGLIRAAAINLGSGGIVQGGSTITQQLAKNLFLRPERTLQRKVQELVLALWLEYNYTKDEILEMYLNRVYLGAGATGVEAAARVYYDKSARDLTPAESATIAGLLRAPSRYAPTRNPEVAQARAQIVLGAMHEAGFITDAEAKNALLEPAAVKVASTGQSLGYVADWVAENALARVGELRKDIVVETMIDPKLQAAAERALAEFLDKEGAERAIGEGAIVTMDPDGAVRALLGGRNYMKSQFNRAVKAKRQPGSAFKPFVYLAALEAGLSPETLRTDAPTRFGDWTPGNYSGEFRGPTPLVDALAQSINTVAVRVAAEVGPDRVVETANRLGISSELADNLSLALGTSEVSLLEMVAANAAFANGGYGVEPYTIRRIRTADGDVLYENPRESRGRVISEEAVGAMNYMMRQTVKQGTGRGAAFGNWPAAGKTGTSQAFRDAWFIGYTANAVTGVWLGNDDNAPTRRVTGGSIPARVWRNVMETAHEGVMVAELPGHYVPQDDPIIVDRSLPWLRDDAPPERHMAAEPAHTAPQQPSRDRGFFNIDAGFLERLFGS